MSEYGPVAKIITTALLSAVALASDPTGTAAGVSLIAVNTWDRFRQLSSDKSARGKFEKEVAQKLQAKVRELQGQELGANEVEVATSAVAATVTDLTEEPRTFVEAVKSPDRFHELAIDKGAKHKRQIEERAEQPFDILLEAATKVLLELAPESPLFNGHALTTLLEDTEHLKQDNKVTHASLDSLHSKIDDQGTMLANLSPSQPPLWPVRFGAWPVVAPGFIKREMLEEILRSIAERSVKRTAFWGMPGAGKSQIAAYLSEHFDREGWELVAWLNASSREQALSDMARLADRFSVPTSDDQSLEQKAQACRDLLSSQTEARVLLVLDNVEGLDDLKDLVPRGKSVRVVATSRSKLGWEQQNWVPKHVDRFERSESVRFLLEQTGQKDERAADLLADALGDLPLALSQAAQTIILESSSLVDYLSDLESTSLEQAVPKIEGDPYPEAVAVALWMAVEKVVSHISSVYPSRGAQVAWKQLGALALLSPSGVPRRWLVKATGDGAEASRVLGLLTGRSVCQRTTAQDASQNASGQQVVMLHRLQAKVIRDTWDTSNGSITEAAISVFEAAQIDDLPQNDFEGRRWEVLNLVEQLRSIAASPYSKGLLKDPRTAAVLARALWDASVLGAPHEALTLKEAVAAVENRLGPDHPDTLASRNNLAYAYLEAGKHGEAIGLYEQTLADRKGLMRSDDPDILTIRNNLAHAYNAAGRHGEATTLYEQTLADTQRVLGPDHPQTLATRNNLAAAYKEADRLDDAILLYEQTLADRERVLGPDHRHTLGSRNNLATAYKEAGRLDEAIPLYEQTLTDTQRLLGPDHPQTLATRNNLALAYQEAGRLEEAIPQLERTLTDTKRVLGPDHPHTLATRNNLAAAYKAAGRLDGAILLYEQTLADRERVLGPDHPDILSSRNNLATAYKEAGRLDEAIPLYEQTLADTERVLGPDHPLTLTTRGNLATAYQEAGRLDEAIPQLEQTLADRERVLGPNHPDTLRSRNNLALAYKEAGRQEDAAKLLLPPDEDASAPSS